LRDVKSIQRKSNIRSGMVHPSTFPKSAVNITWIFHQNGNPFAKHHLLDRPFRQWTQSP